jgi:hypothetical protein
MLEATMVAAAIGLLTKTAPMPSERLERLSAEVVQVVGEQNPIPFADHAAERTALLLVALVKTESDWREEVERCDVVGHDGEVGLTQLMRGTQWAGHTRDEVCESSLVQLRLGLRRLRMAYACGPTPLHGLGQYNSGRCVPTVAAERTWASYSRLVPLAARHNQEHGSQADSDRRDSR